MGIMGGGGILSKTADYVVDQTRSAVKNYSMRSVWQSRFTFYLQYHSKSIEICKDVKSTKKKLHRSAWSNNNKLLFPFYCIFVPKNLITALLLNREHTGQPSCAETPYTASTLSLGILLSISDYRCHPRQRVIIVMWRHPRQRNGLS